MPPAKIMRTKDNPARPRKRLESRLHITHCRTRFLDCPALLDFNVKCEAFQPCATVMRLTSPLVNRPPFHSRIQSVFHRHAGALRSFPSFVNSLRLLGMRHTFRRFSTEGGHSYGRDSLGDWIVARLELVIIGSGRS